MNFKFSLANKLSSLDVESEFWLESGDHCATQKSISFFILNKLIVFSDLPVSGIATRILLSLNLNQYLKMWVVMVMFWDPSHSFIAFYPLWLCYPEA